VDQSKTSGSPFCTVVLPRKKERGSPRSRDAKTTFKQFTNYAPTLMEMEMDGTATPPQLRCVWETHTSAYFSFGHISLEKRERKKSTAHY
jgi:hypothetical protein